MERLEQEARMKELEELRRMVKLFWRIFHTELKDLLTFDIFVLLLLFVV